MEEQTPYIRNIKRSIKLSQIDAQDLILGYFITINQKRKSKKHFPISCKEKHNTARSIKNGKMFIGKVLL